MGLILDAHLPRDGPSGQAWLAETAGSRVLYPQRGTAYDLGARVRLEILHPGEAPLATRAAENDNGLVLRLSWGKASFLFTSDLGTEGEAYLLAQGNLPLDSTVLKLAHHGTAEHASRRFLEAVSPEIAVISVGADTRFGHPNVETLARLREADAQP